MFSHPCLIPLILVVATCEGPRPQRKLQKEDHHRNQNLTKPYLESILRHYSFKISLPFMVIQILMIQLQQEVQLMVYLQTIQIKIGPLKIKSDEKQISFPPSHCQHLPCQSIVSIFRNIHLCIIYSNNSLIYRLYHSCKKHNLMYQ